MHHMQCTRAVNQWRFWANTKKWAHFMSSSDSGYPACPTESCCYLKFVHRIEYNNVAYIITAFFQFSFLESMDRVDWLASFKKAKLKANGHPYPIQVTSVHRLYQSSSGRCDVIWTTCHPATIRTPLGTGYRPTPSRRAAPTGHRRLSEFTAMARLAISLHHPEVNV